MRVVKAAPAPTWGRRRFRATPSSRAARLERLGLAVTTPVLLLGLWLTYAGQTASFEADTRELASGRLVLLSAMRSGNELVPFLDAFPDRTEQAAVGAAIYRRVKGGPGVPPLQHVGGLASATRTTGEPVLKAVQLAALKPHVVVRTPDAFRRAIVVAIGVFMLAFWIAHVVRWLSGTTGDAVLLPAVHLLTGLGLMEMLALRDPLRDMLAVVTVAWGVAAGCLLWTAIGFVDFENPRLRRAVLPPLCLALVLAVALLVFGSGPTGSSARVNLLGMQPVEPIRLLVVFALAAYFARRWQFLRELSTTVSWPRRSSPADSPRAEAGRSSPSNSARAAAGNHPVAQRLVHLPRWKDVRPLAVTLTALLALFFLQGDLGPALVLSCVFLGLYGISRARAPLVLCGFAVLVAGFAAGYVLGVPATVTRRVAIALDPWNNALAGGDQISQALWAMSSGGLLGLGPGIGDPQVIPAGHTDLVMAALGEELGFAGFAAVVLLFAIVVWRMLRIAARAPGDYTMFLAAGLTLAVAVQGLVIVAGMLGLFPLAGVVTPFLSYGRSSMLSNFAAIAICAAIGRRLSAPRELFVVPLRIVGWTLASVAAIVLYRAADVQAFHADSFATRANLTQQADGGFRYQYNPRLVAAARDIVRGTIYDRNGLPLATSRPAELTRFADRFQHLGIAIPDHCQREGERCYPLGGLAFHVIGGSSGTNWAASNASYVERDFDARLKGFDDRPETITVVNPRTGEAYAVVRRDYRELLPLVRQKANPQHEDVRRLLARDRNLSITLDGGLQLKVARALETQTRHAGAAHGAAFVVDPSNGDLLASASYPWPLEAELSGQTPADPEHVLDRARYGLYPPGSTFKLVTAVAALRADAAVEHSSFQCVRLPDGRVGGRVPGATRPIRDDPLDHAPHGRVDLHRGLVASCNAYFSHLATRIGARALHDTASAAQIVTSRSPGAENLKRTLPYAGYGQGDVLASPLRMARVAAALASSGRLRDVRVVRAPAESPATTWVSAEDAARLRGYMREVVTAGTGRVLAEHPVAIAGKTGTAEVDHAKSHSWFVGFAPFESRRQIAFAVIVENAGYGARVAAPLAGDIVSAAQALGLIQ